MEIGNVLPHDLDAVKAGGMVVRGGEEGDGGAGRRRRGRGFSIVAIRARGTIANGRGGWIPMATRVRWRVEAGSRGSPVIGGGGDGFGAVGIGGGAKGQMDFGGRGDFDDAVNGKAAGLVASRQPFHLPGLCVSWLAKMAQHPPPPPGPGCLASQLV